MSIEFDIEQDSQDIYYSRSVLSENKVPGMLSWLQKKGIVSSPEQGKRVLLVITISFFAVSMILFGRLFIGGGSDAPAELPLEFRLQQEQEGV